MRFTPGVYVRLGHIQERQNRHRTGVERALERTAADVGCEPGTLLAAFARHWEWRPVREQKGGDTLMALDMVRLAQGGAFSTAILVSGDRDPRKLYVPRSTKASLSSSRRRRTARERRRHPNCDKLRTFIT